MKTYYELTDYERSQLTDEEFERYLDIARMQSDITIDDPEPPIDDILDKLEWVTVYEVQSSKWNAVATLSNRADASTLATLGVVLVSKDYQIDVPYIENRSSALDVVQKRVVTASSYAKHKPDLERRKKMADNRVQQERRRNDMLALLEEELLPLREDRMRCQNLAYTVECIRSKLAEYMLLCDGDETIARRFLAKHYSAEKIELADSWPHN